jgi:flagellar biosynthesis protein FlhG
VRTARGIAGTPFVLLTGGKGGVGKTTLCANLGVALALSGRRVLCADLDLGLANLNVFLRLPAGPHLEDALAGEASFESCVVRGPGGVDVLPASSGSASMGRLDAAQRARLLAGIDRLAGGYDLVLGDSAAGIGPDVLDFALAADRVLVVTTPEVAALTDAYGLIKAVSTRSAESGVEVPTPELIVNRAGGVDQAEAVARKLAGVCERFLARSPRCAGWLPASRVVLGAAARQEPFAAGPPTPLLGGCMARLARRVERLLPDRTPVSAA